MILVTGSTGTVGSEVAKQLIDRGVRFRALVHDPSKAGFLEKAGVEIALGDYHDQESLNVAMQDVDHLFLLCPSGPEQVEMESNVVKAAQMADVTHIVKQSVFGASPYSTVQLNRWHWMVEKVIEGTGLQFTFVRPNFFMQNTLEFASTIASESRFYSSLDDGSMSFIDVRDIASVIVMALTTPGHAGRSYEITSLDSLTYHDVAEKIGNAIGRKVEYVDLPESEVRQGMLDSGIEEWLVQDYLEYQAFLLNGYGVQVTDWVPRLLGRAPISFDQFAHDYASVFMGQARMAA